MKRKAILTAAVVGTAALLGGAGAARGAPFAYVPTLGSSVSQYSVGAGGVLAPLWPPTVVVGSGALTSSLEAPRGPSAPATGPQLRRAYGELPLAFEPNRGQFDRRVAFAAHGAGHSFALTRRGIELSLAAAATRRDKPRRTGALRLRFADPSSRVHLDGARELVGKVSYLVGRDRSGWHRNVPTYSRVVYRDLWPGVNAMVYGNQGRLKYDFEVAPGADPGRIALAVGGARSIRVGPGGGLLISIHGGRLRQPQPRAYQLIDGSRRAVRSRYVLRGNQVQLALGHYDHRRPLVIDPVIAYSTYFGQPGVFGGGVAAGTGIAVDAAGNAYVAGDTAPHGLSPPDAFVAKFNPAGTALVYTAYFGGGKLETGNGIALDAAGNAYVTGATQSNDFPTTPGAFQSSLAGFTDAYVAKLNASGSGFVYSTYLGNNSQGIGIAVDAEGSAYVSGATGPGFPTTANAPQGAPAGANDAFVAKLNPAGTSLAYATYLGGSSGDAGEAIGVDSSGSAYVAGFTASADFPTRNPLQASNGNPGCAPSDPSCDDAFVTKLNPGGTAFVYSTYFGGSGQDGLLGAGNGVAVDAAGSAYVAGFTTSPDLRTTPGALQGGLAGAQQPFPQDAFVAKLEPAGNALAYSTYLGGTGADAALGIGVDPTGNAYVSGETSSNDFPITPDASQQHSTGPKDAFVAKVNPAGSALDSSTYLGGGGDDQGAGIAVDSAGSAYATGFTTSSDFPVTPGASRTTLVGAVDAFVTKLEFIPTTKDDCKNGGWRNFPQFKNEGQCIAFVNHGP